MLPMISRRLVIDKSYSIDSVAIMICTSRHPGGFSFWIRDINSRAVQKHIVYFDSHIQNCPS